MGVVGVGVSALGANLQTWTFDPGRQTVECDVRFFIGARCRDGVSLNREVERAGDASEPATSPEPTLHPDTLPGR